MTVYPDITENQKDKEAEETQIQHDSVTTFKV